MSPFLCRINNKAIYIDEARYGQQFITFYCIHFLINSSTKYYIQICKFDFIAFVKQQPSRGHLHLIGNISLICNIFFVRQHLLQILLNKISAYLRHQLLQAAL